MNRRGFLQLLGGAVVATQLPAALLPAEEKEGQYCVRYIRAYDARRGLMIERVDVAMGFNLELPKAIDHAYRVENVSRSYIGRAIRTMKDANVPPKAISMLESRVPGLRVGDIFGASFWRL